MYGRTIYKEIANVVDEVLTSYITKPNIRQPLFSAYCDGKKSKCPGRMTQWGAKELGDKGYKAIDILKSFYGYDIYLAQARKVQGVPQSYPGTALKVGSSGQHVSVIQNQLNTISKNYPAIPKLAVNGRFDEKVKNSVMEFQKIFNLARDGIVGIATWYKISYIFVAVTNMAEL